MTHSDTPEPPESAANQIPERTTPTWEVEMIISGAAVFAMLQLPGWLDQRVGMLTPRFDVAWAGMLQVLSLYWICAAVVLAITFTVHLSLRAHWIALVGTHSVFPNGIRWSGLRFGPVQREATRERLGSIDDAIERADNRATIVFAIGVSLASLLIAVSVVVGLLFLAIVAIQLCTESNPFYLFLFFGAAALLALPYMLLRYYDRRVGAKMPGSSHKRRWLKRVFRAYARVGIGRNSYAWMVLSSHFGERRQTIVVAVGLVALVTVISILMNPINGPGMLGNYGLFPYAANSSRVLPSAHYDDQRDITRSEAVPYIQSAVITGPYVRLVVPWQPSRDNAAVEHACGAASALPDAAKRAAHTLDCLAKLHTVSMDGKPLKGLRYDAGSDPRTQRPALVAMIDVRALAPGRHQLDVRRAPAPHHHRSIEVHALGSSGQDKPHDKPGSYLIPFWR